MSRVIFLNLSKNCSNRVMRQDLADLHRSKGFVANDLGLLNGDAVIYAVMRTSLRISPRASPHELLCKAPPFGDVRNIAFNDECKTAY